MGLLKRFLGRGKKDYSTNNTVVAQYEPPEGITAAELGLLADHKSGRLEILATIYDLKTRKIIGISRSDQGHVRLALLKYNQASFTSYEDLVLRYLFHDSRDVMLDNCLAQTDYVLMNTYFQYLLMQELQKKKILFFEEGYDSQPYLDYIRKISANPILHALRYLKDGVSKNITDLGRQHMPVIEGFKHYIETAELDKIKFHAQGDLEGYIEKLTPYAIALNQMERWRIIGIPLFIVIPQEPVNETTTMSGSADEDYFKMMSEAVLKLDSYKVA